MESLQGKFFGGFRREMRGSSYDGRFFLLRAFGFPLVKVGAFLTRKDMRGRSLCVRNSVRSRSFRGNASVFSLFPFLLMRSFQFALVSLVMSYIFNSAYFASVVRLILFSWLSTCFIRYKYALCCFLFVYQL